MKKTHNKFFVRLLALVTTSCLLMSFWISTAYAVETETWESGRVYNVGGFTFTNVKTTTAKTINGSNLTLNISWRKADADRGIGDVKLTIQILDASTGNALTNKQVFLFNDDGTGKCNSTIQLSNLAYGQKIKIWFDASSVNPAASNGNYRSIEITNFLAKVFY